MGRPDREVDVDVALARALLADSCPQFAAAPITMVGEGWDNFVFRLADAHALRVPRRELAVPFLLNEQRFLPDIAQRLSVDVPVPVHAGRPSSLFAWPWSVVPWIDGEAGGSLRSQTATELAEILRALHVPAGPNAPRNPYRGGPLVDRRASVEVRFEALGVGDLEPVWERALGAAPPEVPRWFHGDLHPHNLLSIDGRLSGIIDWGDLGGGDVATDLACGWMLFGTEERRNFFDAYGADAATMDRAAGWAVNMATALLASQVPHHVAVGEHTVSALRADHL